MAMPAAKQGVPTKPKRWCQRHWHCRLGRPQPEDVVGPTSLRSWSRNRPPRNALALVVALWPDALSGPPVISIARALASGAAADEAASGPANVLVRKGASAAEKVAESAMAAGSAGAGWPCPKPLVHTEGSNWLYGTSGHGSARFAVKAAAAGDAVAGAGAANAADAVVAAAAAATASAAEASAAVTPEAAIVAVAAAVGPALAARSLSSLLAGFQWARSSS
mmetsp:Transcript_19992/g.55279  ORF Transcript_19992/g.55279 Transcript_19992/m.55279 type:complete len:222 (-) Transcript_19992:913-1578(-)